MKMDLQIDSQAEMQAFGQAHKGLPYRFLRYPVPERNLHALETLCTESETQKGIVYEDLLSKKGAQ